MAASTAPRARASVARSRALPFVVLATLALALALGLLAGCGGSDGGSADTDADAAAADTTVQLWAERGCAECHGAQGEGVESIARSELIGTRMIIQQFRTRVRNGKGSAMPAYSEAQISDEEIALFHEWLRAKD